MSKKNFQINRPHPWHGIRTGENSPKIVKAYIEITPNDVIKYEICKESGYLKVDRPQKFSSLPPTLYGFVPQTYSAEKTASLSKLATNGDGDPLDICVLSELPIQKSDIIMDVRVIGGIRLIDSGEVDDKLIAVLNVDPFYDNVTEISQVNPVVIDRIKHYFLSYKSIPGEPIKTKIEMIYDSQEAHRVIQSGCADYDEHFRK
ncbi:MAG: inorganic pyrophosphatase [Bdellovibrio sp.]